MQEKLHQLLCSANIAGICIVDDAIGEQTATVERFIAIVETLDSEGILEEANELEEDFEFEQGSPILEQYSRELWSKAQPDKQLQYVRLLCEKLPAKDEELITSLDISSVLKQLKADENLSRMELISISPTQWDDTAKDIVAKIPSGKKILVLFDQKLEQAGGRFAVTKGIDLASEVITGPYNESLLTGILTYTVESESVELAERAKLVAEKGLEPSQLFVLTKKRLEELPRFIDGIKKLLLNSPCERIKVKAIEIGKAALEETNKKIQLLDTYDFSHAVLQSSIIEGVWAPETLFRIIDVIYKDEVKNYLLENSLVPDINNLLSEASEFNRVEVPISSPETYTARYDLRRKEIYAEGRLINGLFKPIENGDIFEVTDGSNKGIYILLSQPCDLMIRRNGERGIRAGNLLKIKPFTNKELESDFDTRLKAAKLKKLHKFNYWETKGLIEYIDEDPKTVGIVDMPRAHIVNLDILDFTMFNSDGVARLDISAALPTTLNEGLAERFSDLNNSHKKLHAKVQEYSAALKGVKGGIPGKIIQDILPNLSLGDKLAKSSLKGNIFSFGIKRVKALRDPYAKNLLDKYTRYLSRTGNLHDFA